MFHAFYAVALPSLMLLLGAAQAAEEPAGPSPVRPWFTPVLVEGKGALCDEAIKAAKAHFLSPKRWASFELPGAEQVQPWGDDLVDAKGPIHVQVYTHGGCGSACERYRYVASRGPEPSREHLEVMAKGSPAPAADIALFKGADKRLFSIASGIDGEPDTVEVNRLNDDLTWTACRISTAPAADRVIDIAPAELRASVRELSARTSNMRQGAGNWCGSLRTHERWSERIGARLQEVYYRPWAVRDDAGDSYGSYEQDLSNLQIWAATGVAEHKAYRVFLQQMTSSQAAMAAFYKRRFGWSDGQARTVARQALEGAISSGIRFYMYEPFPRTKPPCATPSSPIAPWTRSAPSKARSVTCPSPSNTRGAGVPDREGCRRQPGQRLRQDGADVRRALRSARVRAHPAGAGCQPQFGDRHPRGRLLLQHHHPQYDRAALRGALRLAGAGAVAGG